MEITHATFVKSVERMGKRVDDIAHYSSGSLVLAEADSEPVGIVTASEMNKEHGTIYLTIKVDEQYAKKLKNGQELHVVFDRDGFVDHLLIRPKKKEKADARRTDDS